MPTHASALPRVRNASPDDKTDFTLLTYTQGRKSGATSRSFRAEAPISWRRERRTGLAAAGILDHRGSPARRTSGPGGWMLSIDPAHFSAE